MGVSLPFTLMTPLSRLVCVSQKIGLECGHQHGHFHLILCTVVTPDSQNQRGFIFRILCNTMRVVRYRALTGDRKGCVFVWLFVCVCPIYRFSKITNNLKQVCVYLQTIVFDALCCFVWMLCLCSVCLCNDLSLSLFRHSSSPVILCLSSFSFCSIIFLLCSTYFHSSVHKLNQCCCGHQLPPFPIHLCAYFFRLFV